MLTGSSILRHVETQVTLKGLFYEQEVFVAIGGVGARSNARFVCGLSTAMLCQASVN